MGREDWQTTYKDILRRYLPSLRRLARSYVRDSTDEEDLMQEIALGLWTALPKFRGDASERTWLYRVAHNTAISFVTNRQRRAGREQCGMVDNLPALTVSPESSAIEDQQRDRLRAAVEDLPLTDRQILTLYFEGLSAAEIEGVTGLSAGSVSTRLSRVRQRLVARVQGGLCK